MNQFKVDWVLINKLAIGPVPRKEAHIKVLKKMNISSIFSLCSDEEFSSTINLNDFFYCQKLVLPDHKAGKNPTIEEIKEALSILKKTIHNGPTFIHCVAAMERSPLICLAWLIKEEKFTLQQSLDYLMQVHPGTNPLDSQLKILNYI